MAFFVGDLLVSVHGCCIDKKAGPLLDPCVELSVGNKLHSANLPVEDSDSNGGRQGLRMKFYSSGSTVAFHGVTEKDALSIAVLDRASCLSNGHEPFMAEAEPLLCTEWGTGGRRAVRTCVVTAPEEVPGWRGSRKSVALAGLSTVRLETRWSPTMRVREPLSLLACAGIRTSRSLSPKLDRPMAAILDLALDMAARFSAPLEDSRWRTFALVACVGWFISWSAGVVAVAVFFLPVTVAIAAAASATAPLVLAMLWALACTGPACEQIWRPALVWTGTRSRLLRTLLFLPVDTGAPEDEIAPDGILLKPWTAPSGGQEASSKAGNGGGGTNGGRATAPIAGDIFFQGSHADGPALPASKGADTGRVERDRVQPDPGASCLLLACYQNLMGCLCTGLEASRWRPRPRRQPNQ